MLDYQSLRHEYYLHCGIYYSWTYWIFLGLYIYWKWVISDPWILFQLEPIYRHEMPVSHKPAFSSLFRVHMKLLKAYIEAYHLISLLEALAMRISIYSPHLENFNKRIQQQERTDYFCCICLSTELSFYLFLFLQELVSSKYKHDILYYCIVDMSPKWLFSL